MIVAIVTALLTAASADVDYDLALRTRAYPLSGIVEANFAYEYPFWGQPANSLMYGLIKPEINLGTAGVYNTLAAQLKVYPLPFLGFYAGGEAFQNDADYSAYNCNRYQCTGRFTRGFLGAKFGFKIGRFVVGLDVGQNDWRQKRPLLDGGDIANPSEFIEPSWGMKLRSVSDQQLFINAASGLQFDRWRFFLSYSEASATKSEDLAQMGLLLIGLKQKNWSLWLGAGYFGSEIANKEATGVFRLSWRPDKMSLEKL